MYDVQRAASTFELNTFGEAKTRSIRYFSSTRKYQYIAAVSATMGAFGLGSALAWASPGLPSLEADHKAKFRLNKNDKLFLASIPTLGAFFSGALTGFLITRLGRKTTLLLMSAPFVFGWLLIAYAENLEMMYAGRFITGFCGGAFALAAPVFISEIAEPCIRGRLVCLFQIMITMGILFTYAFGAFLDWQWLSIICGLVPLVFLVLMLFMPESPVHHLWIGERAEAEAALCILRGATSESDIEPELTAMIESVEEAKANPIKFKDLMNAEIMRSTIISFSMTVFQQLCGINGLIFFTIEIFREAEVGVDPRVSSIIVGVVQVCATVVAALLVDKVGRRILLLVSYMAMAVSLGLLGTFYFLHDRKFSEVANIGWFPLAMFMAFIIAFSLGSGPVPWVIMGEIIPLRFKGLGSAIVTSCHWIFAFLVTFFFEPIKLAIGSAYCYWIFSFVCILATVHVFVYIPETNGKSLTEIQKMFKRKPSVEKSSTTSSRKRRVTKSTESLKK